MNSDISAFGFRDAIGICCQLKLGYFGCWLGDKLQFVFPSQKPRKAKAKAKANPKAKAKAEAKTPKAKAAKVKAEESEEKNEKKSKAKATKAAKVKAEESEDKKTKTEAPRWVDKMLDNISVPFLRPCIVYLPIDLP